VKRGQQFFYPCAEKSLPKEEEKVSFILYPLSFIL